MKRFIQTGIVLGAGFLLWQVSADARFLDLQKQEPTPIPEVTPALVPDTPSSPAYKSKLESHGISLQFEDLILFDVLQNIQEETGILFSIDPSLETVPFSARIQADNWEAAVRDLLKGFSRVEVWTDTLSTSRVWLLSGGRNVEAAQNIAANRPTSQQTREVSQSQPRRQPQP
jgi:type II secretory pathway component GspD/PulD (secretin)